MAGRKRSSEAWSPHESADHMALAEVFDYARLLYFHPPNELMVKGLPDKQKWRILSKLKKMGLKAGVPDFVILTKPPFRPEARSVFIELKRKKGGRVTPAQDKWHRALVTEGHIVIIARGFDDALKRMEEIGFKLCVSTPR